MLQTCIALMYHRQQVTVIAPPTPPPLPQNYARRHGLPIDAVGFDFEVLRAPDASALTAAAPSGVYVHGLFLEGAGWDRPAGCLCEAAPKQLHSAAPPMWFKTVKLADIR